MTIDAGIFTLHVGNICGGGKGIIVRWFRKDGYQRWLFCIEVQGTDRKKS